MKNMSEKNIRAKMSPIFAFPKSKRAGTVIVSDKGIKTYKSTFPVFAYMSAGYLFTLFRVYKKSIMFCNRGIQISKSAKKNQTEYIRVREKRVKTKNESIIKGVIMMCPRMAI